MYVEMREWLVIGHMYRRQDLWPLERRKRYSATFVVIPRICDLV